MLFHTEADIPPFPFQIDHRSRILMLGSCFTDNVGGYLEKYLFQVNVNPFGVIYNPMSIRKALLSLLSKKEYDNQDMQYHNELWFSFDHYTKFSHPDLHQALQGINMAFFKAKATLEEADVLVLTFGTAYVYRHRKSGEVVCNCHKIPASEFERELLDPESIVKEYQSLLLKLKKNNPALKIILTVSPVRHWKDGAHGNQISKATLLLATDQLCKSNPDDFFYFPSYELVMDELRDYRYYARDMVHLSDAAVHFIWEKFSHALISDESHGIIRKLEPLLKLMQHKALHPDTEAYRTFLEKQKKVHEKLKKDIPWLPWSKLNTY